MKKLLTAVAVLGVATLAFGQGQVNFLNSGITLVSTAGGPVTAGATAAVKDQFNYGLFWAPTGTTDPAAFTFVAYGTNQASAGRFLGGSGTASAPAISGQAIGSSVNVLFRGWSANFGLISMADRYSAAQQWTKVAAAVAAPGSAGASLANAAGPGGTAGFYYGESAIGTVILGGGTTPIQSPFAAALPANAGQIASGFTLSYYPVPEPSTMALAGLGAAALLVFRRRK